MATTQSTTIEVMGAVPARVRGRIISGMRWTFWLSAIAVPFSYGTSILLARVGPEVIGTYGLLMVYIGIVSSLFYFGGDAVIIRFVPMLEREKRLSFLFTYFLIVLGFVAVWLVSAAIWPRALQYLFGNRSGSTFQLQMLCLSPLYVLFSFIIAAHKAVLEMRWAHLLMRVLTIGSFLLYAALYVSGRNLLGTHYTGLIWGIYLGLTALATIFGLRHLLRLDEWQSDGRSLSLYLPRGFWHYTLTTEQVSAVSFLLQRLDLILIMNLGGLVLLGKYVAVLTVAESIRTANRFFVDTLLPSLTNMVASGNILAASQVFSMNLRLLFLVNLAGMGGLILFVDPVLSLFGPQYVDLRVSFILLALFYGVSAPGTIGGTLLSAVGKQQHAFLVCLGQLITFVTLFAILWPHWHLSGAIIANGISSLVASVGFLVIAKRSVPWISVFAQEQSTFVLVGSFIAITSCYLAPFALGERLMVWICAIGVFLIVAKYSYTECREMLICFLPGSPPPPKER